MIDLERHKPDPIPSIDIIAENAATGTLAETYQRTRSGLNVPWMGVVAMAFARYPRFYDCLWGALEPIANSSEFADACANLRATAQAEEAALSPPSILPHLRSTGYSDAEIDDIRACNETFSAGNMPYVLMATLARRVLEGHYWSKGDVRAKGAPLSVRFQKPILIEAHHADASIVALYADIKQTLGLPFVNTDYRAFVRWPSYFEPAWHGLKQAVVAQPYERHVTNVHERAVMLSNALPNVTGLDSRSLRNAAEADASLDEVLAIVRLFQWLLPGLALNVAFLRAQLLEKAD